MAFDNTIAYRRKITAAARAIVPSLLEQHGGQAGWREILTSVKAKHPDLMDDAVPCQCGQRHPQWEHAVATAMQTLKNKRIVISVSRGTWALSSLKPNPTSSDTRVSPAPPSIGNASAPDPTASVQPVGPIDQPIAEVLLDKLRAMGDKDFEELVGRVFRHLGYEDVVVVGRSGDGGIDIECVFRLRMVEPPMRVVCQVKRHLSPVGPSVVGDLRGRWAHRADRLVLVNVGGFTNGAEEAAQEQGAKQIALVAGSDLANLMLAEGLGVRKEPVVRHELDETFFSPFSS